MQNGLMCSAISRASAKLLGGNDSASERGDVKRR